MENEGSKSFNTLSEFLKSLSKQVKAVDKSPNEESLKKKTPKVGPMLLQQTCPVTISKKLTFKHKI